MKAEINIKAFPGDEVWIAFDNGPFKATIKSVETHIYHFDALQSSGNTIYYFITEDGMEYHAYGQAIFFSKEEAQLRISKFNNAKDAAALISLVSEEAAKEQIKNYTSMKIKFKKLVPGAVLPKKATEGSAAYDLYVPEDVIIKPGRQIIPLGFAMEIESGHEALVDPRSGFSSKGMEGYEVLYISIFDTPFGTIQSFANDNKPEDSSEIIKTYTALDPERFDCDVIEGKIDADYRDGVGVIVHNHGPEFLLKAGTRIAQMTFHKVETVEWEETDTLSETDRDGGFGSTGTK